MAEAHCCQQARYTAIYKVKIQRRAKAELVYLFLSTGLGISQGLQKAGVQTLVSAIARYGRKFGHMHLHA